MNPGKPSMTDDLFRNLEVVCCLQVDPVLGRLPERFTEKQSHFGGDGPFPFDNIVSRSTFKSKKVN
jgi:hypothetical protein